MKTMLNSIPIGFVVLFGSSFLAGCNDYTSPHNVLGSAYTDIQKNDLKAFRKTLSSDFKRTHDTFQLFTDLRAEFLGKPMPTLSPSKIVSQTVMELLMCQMGYIPDYEIVADETSYEVFISINGTEKPLYRALITCFSDYQPRDRWGSMERCYERNVDYCEIAELK